MFPPTTVNTLGWIMILTPALAVMAFSLWYRRNDLVFWHHFLMASIEQRKDGSRQWISIAVILSFAFLAFSAYAYFLIALSGAFWGYWSYAWLWAAPAVLGVGLFALFVFLVLLLVFQKPHSPAEEKTESDRARAWRENLRARLRRPFKNTIQLSK